jgi:hypothetical protein
MLNKYYSDNRLLISEWVKFSLQLHIEDEVTRRNIVSLMFSYISEIETSYDDYQFLLKPQKMLFGSKDTQLDRTLVVDYDSEM